MAVNIAAITTLNRARLYAGQPGTSESTVYTVPASTDAKVTEVVITNTSAAPATVSLSAVPTGGTAGNTNRLLAGITLDGSSVVIMDMSVYLTAGDFLSAVQATAGAITLTISGETYA
jgi:hypothetical protein